MDHVTTLLFLCVCCGDAATSRSRADAVIASGGLERSRHSGEDKSGLVVVLVVALGTPLRVSPDV